MPPTPRDHTTGRCGRRYDPLRTEAAFDDAFGEAQAHHDHQEEEVDDNSDDEFPTDPAIFTDHDNHDGTAHLRDDDSSNVKVAAADDAATETAGQQLERLRQRLERLRQNFNPRNNSDDQASSTIHNADNTQIEAAPARENHIWYRDSYGDRPLTWSLYEQFNEWFIALDNDHGVFAAAFSKATIEGAWSNTHNIIDKFRIIVSMVCKKYKQIILNNFGFNIEDIGVHSWRKLARLQESSNGIVSTATAVYTGAAACIRGGHSKGKNLDVYISHHVGLLGGTLCTREGHSRGRNLDVYIEHVVRS
jgi:hypothetical protein